MRPLVPEDIRTAEILARSTKANDFLAVARTLAGSRAANMLLPEFVATQRLSPTVVDICKAGVSALGTTGAAADLFAPLAVGFAESLRATSVFDRARASGAQLVPLHARAISITSAISVGSVGEGHVKPCSSLALTDVTLTPQKVAGIVMATNELLKFVRPTDRQMFDTMLREAAAVASNTAFLAWLVAQTTPTPSAGATTANVLTDLAALVAAIDTDENSRLFLVVASDDAKALPFKVNIAGALQFPNFSATRGGEVLPGIEGVISNQLPAGAAVLFDAHALLLADEGFTLDLARQASLQMDTAPDSPETAGTVVVNLWQQNIVALRAERTFGFALGRANAVASLSGVNY